ncbi:hypothetical protein MLD52_22060 [Puniceicoccaceae bacterium K14]|nr:hypothetical protein [Puniceicoccaceae bacterium K14]
MERVTLYNNPATILKEPAQLAIIEQLENTIGDGALSIEPQPVLGVLEYILNPATQKLELIWSGEWDLQSSFSLEEWNSVDQAKLPLPTIRANKQSDLLEADKRRIEFIISHIRDYS